ncbi:MAG: phosphoribosylglycinamide formyltransferase [Thermodesulfovibrio sp.]|nr:phosphoribosylglycinamide formyltransferase [Thermodesulfovibrio sp.]MDW7998146.1 phosphoribosylglycinamide formyltransferase [Thermodesulfovibrio sp.]
MVRLGVLASGRGSNFQAIIDEIEAGKLPAKIEILIVDNPNAYAIERAKKYKIPYLYINPKEYSTKDAFYEKIRDELLSRRVELVILAGFMRIVRKPLLDAFPNRIMNIHPALLPSFPGLHGQRQAVDYGVRISGCTVHFVDEGVDTGPIIIQAAVPVYPDDTEDTLAERILRLEHKIFPEAIRLFAEGRLKVEGRKVKILDYKNPDICFTNPEIGK